MVFYSFNFIDVQSTSRMEQKSEKIDKFEKNWEKIQRNSRLRKEKKIEKFGKNWKNLEKNIWKIRERLKNLEYSVHLDQFWHLLTWHLYIFLKYEFQSFRKCETVYTVWNGNSVKLRNKLRILRVPKWLAVLAQLF